MNRKRTRRLWREEGLRRPPAWKRKRRRPEHGELFRATHPGHVWALAMRVGRTCDADDVVATIEALPKRAFGSAHSSSDGSGIVAFELIGMDLLIRLREQETALMSCDANFVGALAQLLSHVPAP